MWLKVSGAIMVKGYWRNVRAWAQGANGNKASGLNAKTRRGRRFAKLFGEKVEARRGVWGGRSF